MPLLKALTLCDLTPTWLLSLIRLLPCPQAQQHSSQVPQITLSSPVSAFFTCLSSILNVLLPMAFKLRSYLSFKLHSSMTSSGKLSLMLQNNLCNSHRTSQYTYHKSMCFLSFSSSWLEDKKFTNHLNCTKNVLRTPLPFVIRCIIWDKLFNLFKPRDSPLKYVDNTSTNSWYC